MYICSKNNEIMHITNTHQFWDDVYLCRERRGAATIPLLFTKKYVLKQICQNDEVLNQVVGICVSITLFSFLYVYLTCFLFKFIIKNIIDVQVKEQKEKEEMKKTGSLTTTAAWPCLREVSVQYGIKCIEILCHPLPVSLPRHWVQIILFKLQIN